MHYIYVIVCCWQCKQSVVLRLMWNQKHSMLFYRVTLIETKIQYKQHFAAGMQKVIAFFARLHCRQTEIGKTNKQRRIFFSHSLPLSVRRHISFCRFWFLVNK